MGNRKEQWNIATMRVPRVIQTKTPPEEAIKKRPDISDRLVSGEKSDCTGGVYRARTYDLHDVNATQEAYQR